MWGGMRLISAPRVCSPSSYASCYISRMGSRMGSLRGCGCRRPSYISRISHLHLPFGIRGASRIRPCECWGWCVWRVASKVPIPMSMAQPRPRACFSPIRPLTAPRAPACKSHAFIRNFGIYKCILPLLAGCIAKFFRSCVDIRHSEQSGY